MRSLVITAMILSLLGTPLSVFSAEIQTKNQPKAKITQQPTKKTPAKKVVPVKKVTAKKPAKKIAPAKKAAPRKVTPAKKTSLKPAPALAAKPADTSKEDANKKEIESLKSQLSDLKAQNGKNNNSADIVLADYDRYIDGVVRIRCGGVTGSGFLYNLSDLGYTVITNNHVVKGKTSCTIDAFGSNSGEITATYAITAVNPSYWNSFTDIAIIPINSATTTSGTPISGLNYATSSLRDCPTTMKTGSPVIAIGYPSSTNTASRTVTKGIITAHENSLQKSGFLPYPNYFIDASIDTGNSGGLALSKDEQGLCVLGIPTWVQFGQVTSQGIVQNMYNLKYVPPAGSAHARSTEQLKSSINANIDQIITKNNQLKILVNKEITSVVNSLISQVQGKNDLISQKILTLATNYKQDLEGSIYYIDTFNTIIAPLLKEQLDATKDIMELVKFDEEVKKLTDYLPEMEKEYYAEANKFATEANTLIAQYR